MARQINVRLEDADAEALEAAAFINGRNFSEEARAALMRHVAEVKDDPLVLEMLGLKAQRDKEKAEDEGAVSSLEERRDRSRKSA